MFDNTVVVVDLKTREVCESLTISTHRVEPCGVATETEVVIAGGCTPQTPQTSVEAFSPKKQRGQKIVVVTHDSNCLRDSLELNI